MTVACDCTDSCGDLREDEDDPRAVCKGLPRAPEPPLVQVILVPRDEMKI